jgi:putative amide transporter protein
MGPPIVIAISVMWLPVALLFLGKGEARGTGFATGLTGLLTLIGAILEAAVFKGGVLAGLLFVHGLFYCTVSFALLTGLQDLRSLGNVALTTALVSVIYMFLFLTGGPILEGGKQLIQQSNYLALACAGYAGLTFMVWLNAYGKFPAKALAWCLIIWVVVGLWVPGFWLMASGKLPF